MAQRGAIIQSAGPQNVAQSTLGLKGGDVPQNILVPDLMGTIELGRRTEPELLFSQGIVPWAANVSVGAGGAGTFASIELLNPLGYINVWWVHISNGPNIWQIVLGVPAAVLGNTAPCFPRDLRIGRAGISPPEGTVCPILKFGTTAAVVGANILFRSELLGQTGAKWWGPFVCGPAQDDANSNHYVIEDPTVNQALEINLQGYSIPARVS